MDAVQTVKIAKYSEKYKCMNLVCFGVLDNTVQVTGPSELRSNFALKPEVQAAYKEAVLDPSPSVTEEPPSLECSVTESLKTHVFDLSVNTMRSILSAAAGPPNSLTNKSGRRNWYLDRNCPSWWRETGILFHSVNQRGPDGRKMDTKSLMTLVESLQQHCGIVPGCSKCQNKTEYISVFDTAAEEEEMKEEISEVVVENEDRTSGDDIDTADDITSGDADMVTEDQKRMTDKMTDKTNVAPVGLQQVRQEIDRLQTTDMSYDERSLLIMQQVSSWNHFWGLADTILSILPKMETTLSTRWTMKPLLEMDQRYKAFIPMTVGERTVLGATPNGNCIYDAVMEQKICL